jgi:hypothetical protein
MEDQLPRRGGRVDPLLQGAELTALLAQGTGLLDQVLEGVPQPIELPDDQAVSFSEVTDRRANV